MKYFKIILIAIVLTITPIQANNYNNAAAGGIAAGIALLIMATNLESDCKPINYKNYIIGEKMIASPATAMIDDKFDACISKVVLFTGNLKNTESYLLNITKDKKVKTIQKDNGYKIYIATTIVTQMELISGKEAKELYILIDTNGTVIEAESPFENLVGKKLFEVTDEIILREKTFSKEIIYTGISGSELHFQYREYKGNSIRWPFTMDLVFDLEKSDIIKIKRYKIQILEANNTQIIYKVL